MQIIGAVLEQIGLPRPYRESMPLSVGPVDLDGPGPTEALVEIECASLCHSDLSVVDGSRLRPVPMLLGHEAAGRIVEIGTDVTDFAIDDRVVMTFLPRCGGCEGCASKGVQPCVPGSAANAVGTLLDGGRRLHRDGVGIHHHLGVSAFASHAAIDVRSLVRVDPDVPPDVAALMGCAVLTGGGAVVNAARPQPGDSLVVVGLGGVGMAALLVARAYDITVIAIDTSEDKLRTAQALGADMVYAPGDAIAAGVTARLVIEAAGSVPALETAVAITRPGGTTVTVGLPAPDARLALSPAALVGEGRCLVGSYLGSAVPSRDIPRFIGMWRSGRLPVERLVTARRPLSDINEALDALADGVALRQIITMSDVDA
jgi:alcohol dehydrogenase